LDREDLASLQVGEMNTEAKAQLLGKVVGPSSLHNVCRFTLGQWLTLCHGDDPEIPGPPPAMDIKNSRFLFFGDSLLNCYGGRTTKNWGTILKERKGIEVETFVYPGASANDIFVHFIDWVLGCLREDENGRLLPFPDNWYVFIWWNGNELAGDNGSVPDKLRAADEECLKLDFTNLDAFSKLIPKLFCQIGGTADIWKLAPAYDKARDGNGLDFARM
jgi:hypothetical protein